MRGFVQSGTKVLPAQAKGWLKIQYSSVADRFPRWLFSGKLTSTVKIDHCPVPVNSAKHFTCHFRVIERVPGVTGHLWRGNGPWFDLALAVTRRRGVRAQ